MRVIKRYPNRKLYDTQAKKYVNMDNLADLIQDGEEIQVIDNASGEDLTAVTLTQVISGLEKKRSGIMPRSVLSDLIQAGGSRLNALQRTFMSQVGFLNHVDDEIKQRIHHLVSQGEMAEQEASRLVERLISAGSEKVHGKHPISQDEIERILDARNVPSRQDMDNLLGQLDELLAKLDSVNSENPSSPQSDD